MPIEMREMTLFASAFAMPMNICARLFLFDKPIKCFAFLFTFCFYVYFSRSYESRSILALKQCFYWLQNHSIVYINLRPGLFGK